MIYILGFIIGCLIIAIYKLNRRLAVYKNNYYTAMNILGDYDPSLKSFWEEKIRYEQRKQKHDNSKIL